MKGTFGKAFIVTLLFSQLPVAAMQPALNAGRQALAQYAPIAKQALVKAGERMAQRPDLVLPSVASAAGIGAVSAAVAVGNKLSKPVVPVIQVVTQVAKPTYKQMAKNAGAWLLDQKTNKWILIKDHKALSGLIAAGLVVEVVADYFGYGLFNGAKSAYRYFIPAKVVAEEAKTEQSEKATEVKAEQPTEVKPAAEQAPVVTKAWYNPTRYFGKTVKAEQKPEVAKTEQSEEATEVTADQPTDVKPGMLKRAWNKTKNATVSMAFGALNHKYKVAGTLGVAGAGIYFRNGLMTNGAKAIAATGNFYAKHPTAFKRAGGAAAVVALGAGYALQNKWSVRHPLTFGNASAQVVKSAESVTEFDKNLDAIVIKAQANDGKQTIAAEVKAELAVVKSVLQGSPVDQLWFNALNLAVEGFDVFAVTDKDAAVARLVKTVELIKNR
ncbi:hypothetical protein CVU75_03130 [Candidatus Dependentiae bacterium HGW-Dependentiae-1]|nr:MAG: hypothetical protein CVU75_03130 [Candidatus Dependentiae bacterium HGW-Dependentiae-1]